MELMRSVGHTALLYLLVVAALRLMGKRQVGDMMPSEFVVTLFVSEMAAIPMQDPEQPLINGIVPVCLLTLFELALSWGFLKSRFLLRVFEGKAAILIEKGRIDQKALRRCRMTLAELFEMLRLQGYTDISQLQYAIFEANGQLSVIPYEAHKPLTPTAANIPTPEPGLPQVLISDGKVMKSKLHNMGLDENWLQKELAARKIGAAGDVFVLTRDECGNVYCLVKG